MRLALLMLVFALLVAACSDGGDPEATPTPDHSAGVLIIDGKEVGEATLTAAFEKYATAYPTPCQGYQGMTGAQAYNAFLKGLFEALPSAEPFATIPATTDVERAGQILLEKCGRSQ